MTKKKENTSKFKVKTKLGHLRRMWQHIRRAPFQSFTAILVMWLNYFLASFIIIVILGFSSLIGYFQSRPEVTAFINDKATNSEIEDLQEELGGQSGVKEVRFISKEEAYKIYQEDNKDNPLLLEMVNAEMLPASLEVSAGNPEDLTQIAEFLQSKTDIIDDIIFQEDVVQRLSFWVRNIRNFGLIMVGIFALVSLVVIMVIIGMKISSHRNEIAALWSIGAGNFYIQVPFLLEGMFYSLIGAILGSGMVLGALFYWKGEIENFFSPVSVLPTDSRLIGMFFGGELAFGLVLGLVAAWLASRRYIKK